MQVTKEIRFEAAHRLQNHPGACSNLHGHSYRMEVTVEGSLNANDMVIDFGNLSRILKEVVNEGKHKSGNHFSTLALSGTVPWDHATILETDDALFGVIQGHTGRVITLLSEPTAEIMAAIFARCIQSALEKEGIHSCRVRRVRLWVTEKSFATWDVYDDEKV